MDGRTDGRTNGPTKRVVESRSMLLKNKAGYSAEHGYQSKKKTNISECPRDRWTNGTTDVVGYRVSCTRLKRESSGKTNGEEQGQVGKYVHHVDR